MSVQHSFDDAVRHGFDKYSQVNNIMVGMGGELDQHP
jgi:hypothetical protein